MIVRFDGKNVSGVPLILSNGEGLGLGAVRIIRLMPGYSEIPDAEYFQVRDTLGRLLKDKTLTEFAKEEKNPETGETTVRGIALRRFPPDKAREAVRNCYCLRSLELWLTGNDGYELESRDEIRVLIKEQMELIKAGGPAARRGA